jgi:hypothetical protein
MIACYIGKIVRMIALAVFVKLHDGRSSLKYRVNRLSKKNMIIKSLQRF